MKKIILIIMIFCLMGCSFINPLKSLTPKNQTTKTKKVDKSSEDIYYKSPKTGEVLKIKRKNYKQDYSYTKPQARFGRWLGARSFPVFLIIIALCFFCPGFFGWLIGFFLNGTRNALKETITAVKKYRKAVSVEKKEELDNLLRAEQSKETKLLISKERNNV